MNNGNDGLTDTPGDKGTTPRPSSAVLRYNNDRRPLTDGRDERRVERVVREPEQDACLAHARIADQQQLEQQIVRLLGHLAARLLTRTILGILLRREPDRDVDAPYYCGVYAGRDGGTLALS